MKERLVLFGIILFFSLLIGCVPQQSLKEVTNAPTLSDRALKKPFNPLFFEYDAIKTLHVSAENFTAVAEWLDDETILYIVETPSVSEVYSFNIYSGESSLFYKTNSQILSIQANEKHNLFAIHSAPSFSEAILTVVSASGEHKKDWSFSDSTDMVFTWDPYLHERLIVSSFREDWSYEGFLLDVTAESMVKKELANPFLQWLGEQKIGYINWNQDEPSLSAPLDAVDLLTNKSVRLFEQVIMFQTYNELLVTVSSQTGNEQMATYQFVELPSMAKGHQFTVPLLSMYSNYLVPFYDYVKNNQLFYTFRPFEGGSVEGYTKDFQFISFDVKSGELKVELEGLENKPIKFSPNGLYCLYGYQLEQLIIVTADQVIDLVDYS